MDTAKMAVPRELGRAGVRGRNRMSETERASLEAEFKKLGATTLEGQTTPWQNATVVRGLSLLGLSIVRLDRTSSRLATIYIWLTVALGIIGVVQVVLMFRGH
jgi:hypothetical protein